MARHATIANKPAAGCSWPVGREHKRGNMEFQLFCCAPRAPGDHSYCAEHRAASSQQPKGK